MGRSLHGLSAEEKGEPLKGYDCIKGPTKSRSRRFAILKCELDNDRQLQRKEEETAMVITYLSLDTFRGFKTRMKPSD